MSLVSLNFYIWYITYFSCPERNVVSHCGLICLSQMANRQYLFMYMYAIHVSFRETSIHVFGLFLIGFKKIFFEFLYILDTCTLSDNAVCKYFLPVCSFVFPSSQQGLPKEVFNFYWISFSLSCCPMVTCIWPVLFLPFKLSSDLSKSILIYWAKAVLLLHPWFSKIHLA